MVFCEFCDEEKNESDGLWVPVKKEGKHRFFCFDCCKSIIRSTVYYEHDEGEPETVSRPVRHFDLQGLADRLERVFPRMVKPNETAGVIVVMDRIKVSSSGVIEGTGPAADRVQKVYDEFMQER